jgi:PD-(D/E)XK nuclease superfamily protein
MTTLRHNLFKFATKELSHSAFWAWVLESVDQANPEFKGPRELGRLLLERLGVPGEPTSLVVETERSLRGGAGRADIWVNVDDRHIVVIENKTSSIPGPAQLAKYQTALKGEVQDVHLCLLSTAFDEEIRSQNAALPCEFVGAEHILSMLEQVTHDHPLIQDYFAWLSDLVQSKERLRRWAFSQNNSEVAVALSTPEGQWALLRELKESITGDLRRGTNTGGHPWTQLWVIKPAQQADDTIFYRVDKAKSGYYLSVRQYQGTPRPNWDEKEVRRDRLREHWNRAASVSKVDLVFERPWNGGKKESEVARLLFKRNPVAKVLAQMPRLHREFLDQLGHTRATTKSKSSTR